MVAAVLELMGKNNCYILTIKIENWFLSCNHITTKQKAMKISISMPMKNKAHKIIKSGMIN
jgi:hypothetical protein